ncbi:MAG: ABC transporter ATP-binding protein [Nitrospinota bacterium]|nr:ABC transporter ATP-binding protein [Nitrospinota bacterium]MDH5678345.1 ABC transporter ATP-binding protein [Nitrospinota bacterium]MDH5755226.1 ABC transporter ATP-binding protein [Nitrospinota bacterium]
MIRAENISKKYGAHLALDNLSFEVEKGEICGFLGPNGAGKTTMMRILTGYMPPSAGRATVAGFNAMENPMEVKKRIGYLPETTPLYTDMRVAEYLDFVAELKGLTSRDERRRKVADVMESAMITDRQRTLIKALSKGYRQRVGLAQALLNDPEALVLDEPSIGLDPKQIVEIRSLIRNLAGKRTIILSSHILPEVQMICSRVLIINNGRLVASDTISGLTAGNVRKVSVRMICPAAEAQEALLRTGGVLRMEKREESNGVVFFDLFLQEDLDLTLWRRKLLEMVNQKSWDLVDLLCSAAVPLEETYIRLISSDLTGPEMEDGKEQDGEVAGSSAQEQSSASQDSNNLAPGADNGEVMKP